MDSAVLILSIFLTISLGLLTFLILKLINNQSSNSEDDTSFLTEEIKKIIETVYKEREAEFKTSSKDSIEKIIDPFRTRIKEFEDEVKKNTEQQLKLHVETKTTIDGLIEKTNQITSDTANLADALRGDSKTQGDYGEMKLRMLLENSGSQENIHYKLQENFVVKGEDGLKNKRPDAIVYLPDDRQIIIDSKFSFRAYHDYSSSEKAEDKDRNGKHHVVNVKERIKELSDTKYNDIADLNSPDMTFLFLGIDDALNVALKYDQELLSYATKKRIALLSPTQLHISIKMIENLWRIDGQREGAKVIYEEAQKLVDKLGGFIETVNSLGHSIELSQKKFEDAMNKLSTGKGSIEARVNKLISIGKKESEKIKHDN